MPKVHHLVRLTPFFLVLVDCFNLRAVDLVILAVLSSFTNVIGRKG
jgi:hypothetical protein